MQKGLANASAPCDSTEQVGPEKLSRRGKIHKCTRCKKEGHNRSTCKEPPTANEARNRRKGRWKSSQTPQQPPDPVNAQPSQQPPQQTPDPDPLCTILDLLLRW
ncbi:hypothetical protein K1719_012110 [Acacia pycnantha]|nr:hypothetical protein K1719_012110 [Acacia pycnantha]